MQEHEPFITLKDHKKGFPYHMSHRLLNSSKKHCENQQDFNR